jgi:hypothetical protein
MPPKSTPSKEHHSPPAFEETSDAHADAPTIAFVGERRVAKQQKEVWKTWPHTRQHACSVPITVADVTIQFESVSEATLKNKEMPEGWQNRNGHQMWKLQQALNKQQVSGPGQHDLGRRSGSPTPCSC